MKGLPSQAEGPPFCATILRPRNSASCRRDWRSFDLKGRKPVSGAYSLRSCRRGGRRGSMFSRNCIRHRSPDYRLNRRFIRTQNRPERKQRRAWRQQRLKQFLVIPSRPEPFASVYSSPKGFYIDCACRGWWRAQASSSARGRRAARNPCFALTASGDGLFSSPTPATPDISRPTARWHIGVRPPPPCHPVRRRGRHGRCR